MAVQFEFDDVSAAIAALETQGHSIPEEMTIKKDDCELRMNTVPTMIQAGMLTEEGRKNRISFYHLK